MICPRCGTVAAGQSATCNRCGGKLGRGESRVTRAEPPVPRAPTHRGERAQRAAGIVPQVLARPKKPAPAPAPGPDSSGVAGPQPRPPDHTAPEGQAWPPPPAVWEPGPSGASSGQPAGTAGRVSSGPLSPPEPAGTTGRMASGPPSPPESDAGSNPAPAPGWAPPARAPSPGPAPGWTTSVSKRRSPFSRVPATWPRAASGGERSTADTARTQTQHGDAVQLPVAVARLPVFVLAFRANRHPVLRPGQPPGPDWRHDRSDTGQSTGAHLVSRHGGGVYAGGAVAGGRREHAVAATGH